jgi:chaperone required for assembly of F1-ATPase
MKRFWQQVTVTPDTHGCFNILLDHKILNTPAGHAYTCPTHALADAVAAEWAAVADKINPKLMPMTQLTATALDLVPTQRAVIIDQIAAYAATDLLCYRAAEPAALAIRQQEVWQPYLDWAMRQFDALLKTTTGVQPVTQDAQAILALRRAVEACDDFHLAALQNAVTVSGSLVLGLALITRWCDADAIFHAAELDASFQMERWGREEAAVERQKAVRGELMAVSIFVTYLSLNLFRK